MHNYSTFDVSDNNVTDDKTTDTDTDTTNDSEKVAGKEIYNKILNSKYGLENISELDSELQFLQWLHDEKKYILSNKKFDKIIDYLVKNILQNTKTEYESLLGYLLKNKCYECLTFITSYKINHQHVNEIIQVIEYDKLQKTVDCSWVDNLLKNDFIFTVNQYNSIIKMNVTKEQLNKIHANLIEQDLGVHKTDKASAPSDDTVKQKEQEDALIHFNMIKILTEAPNCSPFTIMDYIKNNNVLITYEILFELPKYMITSVYYVGQLMSYGLKDNHDIKILKMLYTQTTGIDFSDKEIINYVHKTMDTFLDSLADNPISNEHILSELDFIFSNNTVPSNTLILLSKCIDRKIYFPKECLKKLMQSVSVKYNHVNECIGYKFDVGYKEPTDEYFQILSMFLEDPALYTSEFLETVVLIGDDLMFDMIIDKIPIRSIKEDHVLMCCRNGNEHMLEKLVKLNNKLISKHCISVLEHDAITNPRICDILFDNGLIINHELISIMLSKNLVNHNLQKFGIAYDIELYKICHLHANYPKTYIDKMFFPNIELRNKIRDSTVMSKEIIDHILDHNVNPDQMMYDDAVRYNKSSLVLFLENNFGFEPNLDTCVRIDDYNVRNTYFERISV